MLCEVLFVSIYEVKKHMINRDIVTSLNVEIM